MPLGRTAESNYDPNGLLLDRDDAFGESVTIVSGQNLAAGAVLGQITSGGKYTLAAAAAGDGSATPVAVLVDACDASGGDKAAFVYYTGRFRESKLTFGAGLTAAATRRTLAQRGIKVYATQPA
jgi:hypothetical protein